MKYEKYKAKKYNQPKYTQENLIYFQKELQKVLDDKDYFDRDFYIKSLSGRIKEIEDYLNKAKKTP